MAVFDPDWEHNYDSQDALVSDYIDGLTDAELEELSAEFDKGMTLQDLVERITEAANPSGDPRFALRNGREPKCICFNEKAYQCTTCGVQRNSPSAEWQWITEQSTPWSMPKGNADRARSYFANDYRWDPAFDDSDSDEWHSLLDEVEEELDAIAKDKATPSDDDDYAAWWANATYGGKCGRHYGHKFSVKGLDVYASSLNNFRKENEFVPDWGIYFDNSWYPKWPHKLVTWQDFGLPLNDEVALNSIVDGVARAQKGENVEFGCIGGHGRTGTALATVCMLMGMTAKDAIAYVQKNYCEHAIETAQQEWWVAWAEHKIRGTELPPKPERSYGYSSYGYSSGTTVISKTVTCTMQDHYDRWKKGDPKCSRGEKCRFWVGDVYRFEREGFVPGAKATTTTYEPNLVTLYVTPPARMRTNKPGEPLRNGYRVPKAHFKMHPHSPTAKRGCRCDICRYLEAGHEVFLEPAEATKRGFWLNTMQTLDATVQAAEDYRLNPYIYIAGVNGEIMKVPIAADFTPKPPFVAKRPNGFREGEYVFVENIGWVWERLAKVDFDKLDSNRKVQPRPAKFKKRTKRLKKQQRKEAMLEKKLAKSGKRDR